MKKSVILFLSIILLIITGVSSVANTENPPSCGIITETTNKTLNFTDVPSNFWGFDDIIWVTEKQLMVGTSEKLFSPNTDMTRAMLTAVLWRYSGSEKADPSSFADVKRDFWYTEGIDWANANGIVYGMTEDKFAPNDPITREQIAAILYRYAEYCGVDVSVTSSAYKFADSNTVSDWAKVSVEWAVEQGLIQGVNTVDGVRLAPKGNATRAQVAAILHRYDLIDKCIDGNEHKVVTDNAVEVTCTENGLTEGSHCSVCNEIFTEQVVVPATGHTEITVPATQPTCTQSGKSEFTACSICGAVLTDFEIYAATGHSFGEFTTTKEPTYTEEGEKTRTCSVCEFAEVESIPTVVPEHGYVFETEEYTYTYYTSHATGAPEGWNVIVKDNTKTSYSVPESYIYGRPVTQLYKTYSGCKSLVVPPEIPETVSVLYNTYKNCSAITTAPEIPDGVTNLTYAFWGCSAMVEAPEVPANAILKGTFKNCTALTSTPDISTATDLEECFYGCTALSGEVVLATNAHTKAFAKTAITKVILKTSVTMIAGGTFDGCNNLTKVIYEGNAKQYLDITVDTYNGPFKNAALEFSQAQPFSVIVKDGIVYVFGLSADVSDLFISAGTWNNYRDTADNKIARVTSDDLNQSQIYSYPVESGDYTVYVRYTDETAEHSYINFTVE